MKKARKGEIDIGKESRSPEEALDLVQELQEARRQLKKQEKEIKRLKPAKKKQ